VPRRGRPRRGTGRDRPTNGTPSGRQPVEEAADGDWVVRPLTGAGSDKTYRCPGCDQEIPPRTPHVVTWPAYARDSDLDPWDTDSAADRRRHWHTPCWRARDRRR
jgi:hypothetical protein